MRSLVLMTGLVGVAGIVSISLYYSVGGPFGTVNDVCNGLMALLTAVLAGRLHPRFAAYALWQSRLALGLAWGGAVIAVAGSVLVIYGFTGWYLAGLVSMFGYAWIGLWLAGVSGAARRSGTWPPRLADASRVIGAVMSLGLLAAPGILARVDNLATAPWWANMGLVTGVGWFVLYPIWCLWLARRWTRPSVAPAEMAAA